MCDLAAGPKECVHPPDYTAYGYDSREWDGTKILLSKVTYICEPPKVRLYCVCYVLTLILKMVANYNGSANYDIWCSAAAFPDWQFTEPGNTLPLCS